MNLDLLRLIKFEILASACNFELAFLQSLETCSLKSSLLSMIIPSS